MGENMTKDDFTVLELSSFQLHTMKKSPHIAVITNITPNHLNIHKDYEEYIETVVRKVSMPIKAVLGKSIITVSDFVNLQQGDIIKLNSKVDNEMEV